MRQLPQQRHLLYIDYQFSKSCGLVICSCEYHQEGWWLVIKTQLHQQEHIYPCLQMAQYPAGSCIILHLSRTQALRQYKPKPRYFKTPCCVDMMYSTSLAAIKVKMKNLLSSWEGMVFAVIITTIFLFFYFCPLITFGRLAVFHKCLALSCSVIQFDCQQKPLKRSILQTSRLFVVTTVKPFKDTAVSHTIPCYFLHFITTIMLTLQTEK